MVTAPLVPDRTLPPPRQVEGLGASHTSLDKIKHSLKEVHFTRNLLTSGAQLGLMAALRGAQTLVGAGLGASLLHCLPLMLTCFTGPKESAFALERYYITNPRLK